jgi:excisionase family DNA binding protein
MSYVDSKFCSHSVLTKPAPMRGKSADPAAETDRAVHVAIADKVLLTVAEAAALLSISVRTLWTLTENGYVRCVRIGNLKRYRRAALEAWAESEESAPSDALRPRPRKPRERRREPG